MFGGLSFFLPTLFHNNTFMYNNTTDISLFHTSLADMFHFSTKPSQVSVALCLGNFINIDPVILQSCHLSIRIFKTFKIIKIELFICFLGSR